MSGPAWRRGPGPELVGRDDQEVLSKVVNIPDLAAPDEVQPREAGFVDNVSLFHVLSHRMLHPDIATGRDVHFRASADV